MIPNIPIPVVATPIALSKPLPYDSNLWICGNYYSKAKNPDAAGKK